MKRALHLLFCITLAGFSAVACEKTDKPPSATDLRELGEKYLIELDYEQAAVYFTQLIDIDPMNPRGYTGAADAYIMLNRIEEAIAVLEAGYDILKILPSKKCLML